MNSKASQQTMTLSVYIQKLPATLFFSATLLVGCTTSSRVTVARPDEVRGFQSMGSIKSTMPIGGVFRRLTYQAALHNCLKEAEAKGATHFVPDPDSGPTFLSFSETAHGTAYRRP
jgi:hypothetical protein